MAPLAATEALTLVYLDSGMVLSRRPFADWRAVQDHFPNYKTSLAPEAAGHLVDHLTDEYPEMTEETGCGWAEVVAAFLATPAPDLVLCENGTWLCPC